MRDALLHGLSLVDASGYIIIAVILTISAGGVSVTFWIQSRYRRIATDLRAHMGNGVFKTRVLTDIARDALKHQSTDLNTQVLIENGFQTDLRSLLVGERFVKSCPGLLIILGLVGTFYGLTLSIGELAELLSGKAEDASVITESLTAGLTQALTGMSVAFSTSLFGITGAIVMTLLGVFFNVMDRRVALMGRIEAYLDNVLLSVARSQAANTPGFAAAPGPAGGGTEARLALNVASLEQSIARLGGAVLHFESALESFASTTGGFREFNLHLKDNVQRMSLSFGDLSETLKEHARAFRSAD